MRLAHLAVFGALALATAAFLAIACGGNSKEQSTEPAPKVSAPAADNPSGSAEDGANELVIAMVPTLAFDTTVLRAQAGAEITVRFDNQETGQPHNWAVYADDSASKAIAGANDQICMAPCEGEVTFGPLEPGSYFFRCDVHPVNMVGELIVEG